MFEVERVYFQGILRVDKTLSDIDKIIRSRYNEHIRSLISLLEYEDISCDTYIMSSNERRAVDDFRTMYANARTFGDIYEYSKESGCNYIDARYVGESLEDPVTIRVYFSGEGGRVTHTGFLGGTRILRRNVDKLEESNRYLDDIELLKGSSEIDGAYIELLDDVEFKSVGTTISMIKGYGTSLWKSNEVYVYGIELSKLGSGQSTYKTINKNYTDLLYTRRYNNTPKETLDLVLLGLENKLKYIISVLEFEDSASVLLEVQRLRDTKYFRDLVSNVETYFLEHKV